MVEITRGGCSHEAAPIPLSSSEILSGGVIVDTSTLPRAGGSRHTYCIHCGTPMIGPRDTRCRVTIWGWRELMGFDPYGDEMPMPDADDPLPPEAGQE